LSSSVRVRFPEAYRFLFADKADDGLPVRYRAGFGGRGSAKSHSFCSAAVIKGANQPLRIGIYREIQRSIRDSAKRLLDDKIEENGLSHFYESTDTEIRGKNGTLFLFNGLRTNPDAIKSTEGLDIAIVMEANKVAQRSWDLLIPTVRKPGSEIWAEWNPDLPTDPVDVMFRGEHGPPPGSIVRRINWEDNPFFPEVLKAELEFDRKRDPDKYAHIWLGEYNRNSEARVFRNWRVEAFDTPADAVHRFGADWGFSVDPTVLVRCHIVGRTLYVDHEAYAVGCEIDNTPALFDKIEGSRKWTIRADSARPETVSYMQRKGFKIIPAVKGPGSLEDGIEFLKTYDIVVHPRCTHTADELALYAYKTDPLTGDILPVLEDKNNHVIDALRYACEGLRRAPKMSPQPTSTNPPDLWGRQKASNGWKTA
jgi:phage terminase large subunit